jgi:hypothetical protein
VRRSNPWPRPTSTYALMEMCAFRRSERNSIFKSCRTRAGLSRFQGIEDCFAMLAMTLFCSFICRCFRETVYWLLLYDTSTQVASRLKSPAQDKLALPCFAFCKFEFRQQLTSLYGASRNHGNLSFVPRLPSWSFL